MEIVAVEIACWVDFLGEVGSKSEGVEEKRRSEGGEKTFR